jgi:NAD(P)-dependent dehydrogenase (short-subunit alcohol dehydrogenase family)
MGTKIILVTGANKGIGFELVRQLAKLGHQVILTSRDDAKGLEAQKKLKSEDLIVSLVGLDITKEESIEQAFNQVKTDFGKLDVLINNAAVLLKEDRSLLKSDFTIFEKTVKSNAMAQLTITRQFQSIMPNGSRIIMTSSGGGSMSDPVGGWSPAYCVSKSLLGAITRHLAYELSNRKIAVNAFDPGWAKTDMGGKSAPRSVEQGADTAIWLATYNTFATGKFFRDRKEIAW